MTPEQAPELGEAAGELAGEAAAGALEGAKGAIPLFLIVAALVAVSGACHLDGLADGLRHPAQD